MTVYLCVANTKLLCVGGTTRSLFSCLSSKFEKILIPKVEFDAILQYFVKTFETLLFLLEIL